MKESRAARRRASADVILDGCQLRLAAVVSFGPHRLSLGSDHEKRMNSRP